MRIRHTEVQVVVVWFWYIVSRIVIIPTYILITNV